MSRDLSGARKAALLLVQLGAERAARVLQSLDEEEIEAVIAEVALLSDVDDQVAASVLTELVEHMRRRNPSLGAGPAFARKVLASGLGAERAEYLIERIGSAPFQEIGEMPVEQASAVLSAEHPQTVALVLSSLPPDRGLPLLQALPEDQRGDIAFRMAVMEPPAPAVVAAVQAGLSKRLASAARGEHNRWAKERSAALIELLQRADAELEAGIMAEIERLDPALAAEIRLKLFSFEDLVRLEDKALQLVVREVDAKVLALALKGATEAVRQKIYANMSERAAASVSEEADLLGAQRKADVEAARLEVLAAMRALEAEGKVTIARGDESLVA